MSEKITVVKTDNYTVMDNTFLRDNTLSLKARGLHATFLSLPDSWDYSVAGLVKIVPDGKAAINSAIKELEGKGYLERKPVHGKGGQFEGYEYIVFERPKDQMPDALIAPFAENQKTVSPFTEKPSTEKPSTGKPSTGNQPQLNTNELSTYELSTKGINIAPGGSDISDKKKAVRHKHGTYQHVMLTDEQYQSLISEYGSGLTESAIQAVDNYAEETGKRYKNYYLVIKRWGIDAGRKAARSSGRRSRSDEEIAMLEALL